MKCEDYITHIKNLEDMDILTRKGFDVNIRLFHSSNYYRGIVFNTARYIARLVLDIEEGYQTPKGMSGANAGIPLNIIALNVPKPSKVWDPFRFIWVDWLVDDETTPPSRAPVVLVNPQITKRWGGTVAAESNCGSLTLEQNIQVSRDQFIDLSFHYFEEGGGYPHSYTLKEYSFSGIDRTLCGFTIQHEVDHNLGVLITDRQI